MKIGLIILLFPVQLVISFYLMGLIMPKGSDLNAGMFPIFIIIALILILVTDWLIIKYLKK